MTASLSSDRSPGYWSGVWGRLRADRVSMACLGVFALIVGACVFAPWLMGHDPSVGSVVNWLKPVALALLIGGSLGMVAGFVCGRVNAVIMRSVDVVFAFPSILLAVAIAGAMGAGIVNALIALTIVLIPPLVRVTEAARTQVRRLDYVDAAQASGAAAPPPPPLPHAQAMPVPAIWSIRPLAIRSMTEYLSLRDLTARFRRPKGTIAAIDRLSRDLNRGEELGLIGKSGSGKSVTLRGADLRAYRGGEVSMTFQVPATALDPVHTLGPRPAGQLPA